MGYDFQTDHQRHPSLHPYHGPFMANLVDAFATAGGRWTRYASPYAGDANASGAPGDPFNTTSAAAAGVDNAIQQALDSFPVPTTQEEEDAVKAVVLESGFYLGSLALTHRRIMLYASGAASAIITPGNVTRTISAPVAGAVKVPELVITGDSDVADSDNGGINFAIGGTFTFGDAGAGLANYVETDGLHCSGAVLADGGGMTGGIAWAAVNTRFTTAFTLPACDFGQLQQCSFAAALSCGSVSRAYLTHFNDTITVLASPGPSFGPQGFISCDLENVVTFTGPAVTALFDAATQESYAGSGLAFVGGAGHEDFKVPLRIPASVVMDITAGATVAADVTPDRAGVIVGGWILCDDIAAGAGAVVLTLTADGNNVISTANLDMMGGIANGVKLPLILTGTAADLLVEQGSLITATMASDNGATTNGTGYRIGLDIMRDGRIQTT